MSEERKRSVAPWIAGVVLGLLVLYVGAYYLMVRPMTIYWMDGVPSVSPAYGVRNFAVTPWAREFFSPIHQLDCHLRPEVWTPPPDSVIKTIQEGEPGFELDRITLPFWDPKP